MLESLRRFSQMKKGDITFNRLLSAIWRRIVRFPQNLYFYVPMGFPRYNRNRLKSLNNTHKGERCFILANGPSLNLVDFDLLKNEYTFGMNRIYLMKEKNGFVPSCIACIDKDSLVIPFREDFDSLDIPLFLPFELRKYYSKKGNQYFIGGRFSPKFQTDASLLLGNGKTVAYTVIQLAYCMGFEEVYIVGKDHTYQTTAKAGASVEMKGADVNHFSKDYYKPGMKWDAPDHNSEEYAYKLAREAFEKAGRKIMNATAGGKLEIFERIDFNSLFEK